MKDDDRLRLVHGPYHPPAVKKGQVVRCVIRGCVRVAKFTEASIPWPRARNEFNGGRGPGPYIVCGDLVKSIKRESSVAIQHWFGAGSTTVKNWREALGVEFYNEGTKRLWKLWRVEKLPKGSDEPVVAFAPSRLRARRLALGLTMKQVAQRVGWRNRNTYEQLEVGRRRRVTVRTLKRLAKALECRQADLVSP